MNEPITPNAEDFDDMHHALGRPSRPWAESYRNHYCLPANCEQAQRFEALGMWEFVQRINDGRDAVYRVNHRGRLALSDWMKAPASVDTRPKDGDGVQQPAPLASGAVPAAERADAQPQSPSKEPHP